jgi:hypothetical protein
MPSNPQDTSLPESATAMSNTTGDFAFTRNNNFQLSAKRDSPFVPLPPVENEEHNDGEGEGRDFVVFLTTEEEIEGQSYPIDYQKEYFGSRKDAEDFINTMKNSEDENDIRKKYDGYVVPIDSEKEAEKRLNQVINTGAEDQSLPQSRSGEGAYWSESVEDSDEGANIFNVLDEFFKTRSYNEDIAIQFLVKRYGYDETEAEAILAAYAQSKPLNEKRIKEMGYPSNLVVVEAFVYSQDNPKASKNLRIVQFKDGRGLINYHTLLAFIGNDGVAYFNYQKYSITTTKIQSGLKWRLKQAFGKDFLQCDEEEIKAVAEGKDIQEFKTPPKDKKASYKKLPATPGYYGGIKYLSNDPEENEEVEPFDPNFNPYENEDMFEKESE